MLVLIYGKGWLTTFFEEIFRQEKIEYQFSNVRVNFENIEAIQEELKQLSPTHMLCCLGRTHGEGYTTIDYLEDSSKLKENLNDNVFAPIILGREAQKLGVHLTYIGTGCIFEYSSDFSTEHGVTEEDRPNFFGSAYSTAKGFTDSYFKDYLPDCLLLRIRMPVSKQHHSRNFISKILSYSKVCSIPNSVTCIEDMFPHAVDMMRRHISGIYNFTNTGTITHSQIIDWYTTHINPRHLVQYVLPHELPVKAGRSNIYLDNAKMRELYPVRTAEEVIYEIMKNFPKID